MIRVAWLVPGGVAPRGAGMHIPALTQLAERLSDEVELTVFSFSDGHSTGTDTIGRGTVRFLPVRVQSAAWTRGRALFSAFHRDHIRRPFHLIHAFWALPSGVHATMLGTAYRLPSIVTFPGGDTASIAAIGYGNLLSTRSRLLTRFVARRASVLHLLSEYQREQLVRNGIRFRSSLTLPFGVDESLFFPVKKRTSPPWNILHVSNLTEVKDQRTLLRAFDIMRMSRPCRLRIVGPDRMDGALQNFCTELGLSDLVEFMGHIPYGELPMQYAWAHLYLHSSLHEGQSVSVVEAMASGVPVCGTRVGILADLENVCVRCVPPGEHVGLARTASDVLADSEQYERMARAGLEWAGDHTLAWTANGLREVYHAFGKPNAELTGGVR